MQFRELKKLNDLGDIRHMIPCLVTAPADGLHPSQPLYNKFCEADSIVNTLPDKNRGIVTYVRLNGIDMVGMASEMSEEDMQNAYIYYNEAVYQINDAITRQTGKLTKHLKIVNVHGMTMRKCSSSSAYVKKDVSANKALEDFYPQLTGSVLITNSPVWLSKIWNLFRPFFPKRFVEKVDLLPPNAKMKPKDSERFFRYVSDKNLPERYGGRNSEWPPASAKSRFEKGEI